MFLKMLGAKEPKEVHPLIRENNVFFNTLDQNMPLSDYEFVVFDTELTGMNRKKDEIISIGAVRIRGLKIIAGETFHTFVRPDSLEPRDSTLIHRITPEQLEDAPAIAAILDKFIEFCGNALLVGHYVDLDVAFVNRAAKRILGGVMRNPCLDTMRLSQAYTAMCWEQYHDRFNLQVSYNLADLVKTYGLPEFSKHDALEDALQTAYLFLYLVKNIHKHGYHTLKELFSAGRAGLSFF
ncbi:MAG: 3'-5' exonuclease, partial [Proteobacteria bacterium]|nr:3'-5' exonuclease [Pseudomonadota bacterium]